MYDSVGRLSSQSWIVGSSNFSESYSYNDGKDGNGSLTQMTTATGDKINYSYNGLNQLQQASVTNSSGTELFKTAYAYKFNGTKTTPLVEFRNVKDKNNNIIDGYKYSYDAVGNIIQISEPLSPYNPLVKYTYDDQNQLIKEEYYDGEGNTAANITDTYTYTYDTAGNLLTKGDGADTTGYTYGNSTWQDLLTAYNGGKIAYEGQTYTVGTKLGMPTSSVTGTPTSGNPISYYNGTRWDMEWAQGRNLVESASESSNTTVTSAARVDTVNTLNYSYDPDGIRTGKTTTVKTYKYRVSNGGTVVASVDGGVSDPEAASYVRYLYSTVTTSHKYVTQSGKVVRETIGSGTSAKVLDFIYDESGKPFALIYTNGTATPATYYYVLNLQGDVVGLVNSSGGWVAQYTYNAWGEIITSSGSMANINPLRYRGYYFDSETGFYYLQSRYYDPVTHRFINADSIASTGQSIIGTNMFVYCGNQPITRVDSAGNFWMVIVGYKLGEIIVRACNDSHNQKAEMNPETSTKDKLIDDQNGLTGESYRYGFYNVSWNGCEVIAAHNAMVLLGMDSTLTDRVDDFYATQAIIGYGAFGSNPHEIGKVLRKNNIEYTRVGIDEMGAQGAYIVSYWNPNAPWKGLHTIAVFYDGTHYTAYNYGGKVSTGNFDPNNHNNRRFICAYYLGRVTI